MWVCLLMCVYGNVSLSLFTEMTSRSNTPTARNTPCGANAILHGKKTELCGEMAAFMLVQGSTRRAWIFLWKKLRKYSKNDRDKSKDIVTSLKGLPLSKSGQF